MALRATGPAPLRPTIYQPLHALASSASTRDARTGISTLCSIASIMSQKANLLLRRSHMAPPETGFVRASRARSSDGGCHRLPALSADDLSEDAGPSGAPPASPTPADYALPLADDRAADLLASVLAGQQTLAAACSHLFDKRSTHAATAFLRYCISKWPQDEDAATGSLLQHLTVNPTHLLCCILMYMSSSERRTAAEAAQAWHVLSQRVSADQLLGAVLAEPNCLRLMLEAMDVPSSPMPLSICGTAIPFKSSSNTTTASTAGHQASKLSSSILDMVSTASEALLNALMQGLLAILNQQYGKSTAAAAMLLHGTVSRNPATVSLLHPHLSALLDSQHWLCDRDQDYILQVLSAVAATEEGLQHLAQCDLAYLVQTMQQNLSQDSVAAGLAADIIASRLAQTESGRAALLPLAAVLAKVCEQRMHARSAAVAACAVHTLRWIADCSGTEGQEAVSRHIGSVVSALARMTLPRRAAFWEVGAVQAADSTDQRTIVDLAVEDAAALVREACKDRVAAAYLASNPRLMTHLQHAMKHLSSLEAEQPLLDLSLVLIALAGVPAGWIALTSSNSLDVMLKVACSYNSTAAQHALAAVSKVLSIAALGTAAFAAQEEMPLDAPPASVRQKLQMKVAARLAPGLEFEHITQLLCLLSTAKLAYLGYCCLHQLLQIACARVFLQPYAEALTERAAAQLSAFALEDPFALVAEAACATAVTFNVKEFMEELQLFLECSDTFRVACHQQLEDATEVMQQAIIELAETYVATHRVSGGTAVCTRPDRPLMVLLLVVLKAVAEVDSMAELAESAQPQALPGPSAKRLAEPSLHDWLS